MAQETPGTRTIAQLLVGLVWLGMSWYVLHATMSGRGVHLSGALGAAAAAPPGVVAATLLAGASIGAVAGARSHGAGRRLRAGLVLGVLSGLVAPAGIRFGYDGGATVTALAITVGAAAILAGALAVLPTDVL